MNFPFALVVIAIIAGVCFERHLQSKKAPQIQEQLKVHEQAIKNLGEQCLSEISKLKDRIGAMQLSSGFKMKPEGK